MKELKNLKEEDIIFFDIKTAKRVKELKKGTQLYDAWAYKTRYKNELNKKTGKEFTIEEYYYDKAPLYAPFGRVVSIVVGRIRNNKIFLKAYSSYDEKELLANFNKDLNLVYKNNRNSRLCGFNSVGYDVPFLEKRLIISSISPCELLEEGATKPWELSHIDLSKIWKGNAFYPDSLIAVATALGLPSPKDALDGSQVSEAFYNNKLDEIEKYCLKDVETTIRAYRRMALLEDPDEGFEINKEYSEDKLELPNVLETIYFDNQITKESKERLKELLSKKKILKKDKVLIKEIILSCYVHGNFEIMDQDSKKIILKKEEEVNQFIESL